MTSGLYMSLIAQIAINNVVLDPTITFWVIFWTMLALLLLKLKSLRAILHWKFYYKITTACLNYIKTVTYLWIIKNLLI